MKHQKRFARMFCIAIISICVSSIFTSGPAHAISICNVKTYGATGDGSTKDTTAIQNAINGCSGGGIVDFPAGKYLTAPLTLSKDNITLDIERGATILGSTTLSDYTGPDATKALPLISSDGVSNITITGGGVIDGQGATWWAAGTSAHLSPRLMDLSNGSNLTLRNLTLQNAASYHVFLKKINTIEINGITISAPLTSHNTDGIITESVNNMIIENSSVSDNDDNIGMKAQNAGEPSSSIIIRNCTIGTGHGISLGYDITGGMSNIIVSHVTFNGTTNGLRFKSMRTTGGDISHVTYTDIKMTNVAYPIWFAAYYPTIPDSDTAQPVTATTPYYHDITVNNLTATGATAAGYIVGLPEKPLTDIVLNAVKISATTGLEVRNAGVVTSRGTTITVASGSSYIIQTGGSVTAR